MNKNSLSKEWYGWHFPEMAKIISDNIAYAKVIQLMGNLPLLVLFNAYFINFYQASGQMQQQLTLPPFCLKTSRQSSRRLQRSPWALKFQTLISRISTLYANKSSLSLNTVHNLLNISVIAWQPSHLILPSWWANLLALV